MKRIELLTAIALGFAMPAMAEAPKVQNGKLVDEDNMTLYTFDKDPSTVGKSVCEDGCAAKWPPAQADSYDKASGNWSLIKRANGKMQWAYKGKPLYRWVMDKKAGDTMGDGMGGMWHIAKP